MIWITTLCLLFVIAWLIFNGLNERRWVKAHGDETDPATQEDLLYRLSAGAKGSASSGENGGNFFDRVVASTKDRDARSDQRLKERLQEQEAVEASGQSAFDRATRKVAATSSELGKRVAEGGQGLMSNVSSKVSAGMERSRQRLASSDQETGDLLTRIGNRVNQKVGELKKD